MPQMLFEKKSNTTIDIQHGSARAGTLRVSITRPGNDLFGNPFECEVASVSQGENNLRIEWSRSDENMEVVLDMENHPSGYRGRFRARGTGRAIVKLIWELPSGKSGFTFMPAFMYGHNEGGKSERATYPQLSSDGKNEWNRPWRAKEWLVRADRSSHCLTSVISEDLTFAVGGRDRSVHDNGEAAEKNGLGICCGNPHRISFSLGFMNVPYTYSVLPGRNFISRPEGFVNFDDGEAESEIFMFLFPTKTRHESASHLLRASYSILHDKINDAGTVEEAVNAISEALVSYAYSKEAKNFYCTIESDNRIRLNKHKFPTGWTGGLRTAYPLLLAGHQMSQPEWIDCARSVYSNIAENAVSPQSGLFFENYDSIKKEWDAKGWWYDAMEKPGHSGYINGQICHYLLLGYMYEREAGTEYKQWYESAKGVLDHVAEVQGNDGRFGYSYSEQDGTILDGDGFSGCWFTPAFASLYQITRDEKYLNIAAKAMHFYRRFLDSFEVYGGPHDIFKSPDEEGILSWIDGARILHRATGNHQFLDALIRGLDYEFSWKFAYNVVNEVEPLKSMGWCSTGGSVTSVNNSHIHPMGSAIAESTLYAAEQTGDPYIRARLIDTIRWTLTIYLHKDGDYGWGKKGLINERFCYTDSLITERFPDGSPSATWFCGHSWASGAALEGLVGPIISASKKLLG